VTRIVSSVVAPGNVWIARAKPMNRPVAHQQLARAVRIDAAQELRRGRGHRYRDRHALAPRSARGLGRPRQLRRRGVVEALRLAQAIVDRHQQAGVGRSGEIERPHPGRRRPHHVGRAVAVGVGERDHGGRIGAGRPVEHGGLGAERAVGLAAIPEHLGRADADDVEETVAIEVGEPDLGGVGGATGLRGDPDRDRGAERADGADGDHTASRPRRTSDLLLSA